MDLMTVSALLLAAFGAMVFVGMSSRQERQPIRVKVEKRRKF